MEDNSDINTGKSDAQSESEFTTSKSEAPDTYLHFTLTTESEEDDRTRTPSGSTVLQRVSQIREKFLSATSSADVDSGKQSTSVSSNKSVGISQPLKPIDGKVIKKLRGKAKRLSKVRRCSGQSSRRHASVSNSQNKQQRLRKQSQKSVNPLRQFDSEESSEEEGFHTPVETIEVVSDPETVFLHQLAKELKMASDKRDEESSKDINITPNDIKAVSQEECVNGAEYKNSSNVSAVSRSVEHTDMETNDTENPKVIDVASVAAILQDLKAEMAAVRKDVSEIKGAKDKVSEEVVEKCKDELIEAAALSLEDDRQDIVKLKADLKHFKFRNRALTNVVENMAVEINELKQKMENLELGAARNAISITGITFDGRKAELIEKYEEFTF